MRTVNGIKVKSARVYEEDGLWRWRIVDKRDTEYVDGGNHRTRDAAERGMETAFDQPTSDQAKQLRKLIADGGYNQLSAAKAIDVSPRMMRYYCSGDKDVPRVVMLAMEHLVHCAG